MKRTLRGFRYAHFVVFWSILLVAPLLLAVPSADAQTAVIFVDKVNGSENPPGQGDAWGSDHAYKFLQDGLARADELFGDPEPPENIEIWVAGYDDEDGNVYYPDEGDGLDNNTQSLTFDLRENVSILCGFQADVDDEANDRDWRKYKVTLSGDIDGDGLDADNSIHVVRASFVDVTAVLDGAAVTPTMA